MFPPQHAAACLAAYAPDEGGWRRCYVSTLIEAWLVSDASLGKDWGDISYRAQVESRLSAFVEGAALATMNWDKPDPAFRKLTPQAANVWELRTTDIRIFGWFPADQNTWVAVEAVRKKDLQTPDGQDDPAAYAAAIKGVQQWRQTNGMEPYVAYITEADLPLHLRR